MGEKKPIKIGGRGIEQWNQKEEKRYKTEKKREKKRNTEKMKKREREKKNEKERKRNSRRVIASIHLEPIEIYDVTMRIQSSSRAIYC